MDLQLARGRRGLPVVDQEVPFSFDELFFSRTDHRGVILSGNQVFQRISHYSWDELINKPHNLIRHPDMPRAVFWLLWETIKRGQPIGAYVKNRAKDGRYYWVFAIVTPIESGYLSVRFKPSVLLPVVTEEYAALSAAAEADRLTPQDAAGLLLERLKTLGFEDYPAFMATAISRELVARSQQTGREPDRMITGFDELVAAARSLLDQAASIVNAYGKNKFVPLNLSVHAAQLGKTGVTIGVISNNYNLISGELRDNMDRFIASAQQVLKTISDGLFLLCTAKVQQEVAAFFRAEAQSEGADNREETQQLLQQQAIYQEKAVAGLQAITQQAEQFAQDCEVMKQLTTSLEVTRVMGKMESSRLRVAKDGLDELINDLEDFQAALASGLKQIDDLNHSIQFNAGRLLKMMEG